MTPDTEIVPQGTVSIIPPTDLPNLDNAIKETERECSALIPLGANIRSAQVSDASTYAQLGQWVAEASSIEKVPDFKLGPFLSRARRVVDWLRTEQNKHSNLARELVAIGKGKMAEYKRKEIAAAAEEQRRINEERRKAAEAQAEVDRKAREKEIAKQVKVGEVGKREANQLRKEADIEAQAAKANVPEVRVKASVPTVAGIQIRANWKFEIVNATLIPRPFLIADEVAIGQQVRKVVDQEMPETHKKRVEALIPGIRVYS